MVLILCLITAQYKWEFTITYFFALNLKESEVNFDNKWKSTAVALFTNDIPWYMENPVERNFTNNHGLLAAQSFPVCFYSFNLK